MWLVGHVWQLLHAACNYELLLQHVAASSCVQHVTTSSCIQHVATFGSYCMQHVKVSGFFCPSTWQWTAQPRCVKCHPLYFLVSTVEFSEKTEGSAAAYEGTDKNNPDLINNFRSEAKKLNERVFFLIFPDKRTFMLIECCLHGTYNMVGLALYIQYGRPCTVCTIWESLHCTYNMGGLALYAQYGRPCLVLMLMNLLLKISCKNIQIFCCYFTIPESLCSGKQTSSKERHQQTKAQAQTSI